MPDFEKLAPTPPGEGPPLPKAMGVRWPWKGHTKPDIIERGLKFLPEFEVPSPFGKFTLPSYGLPPLKPPKIDSRRAKALGHGLGADLAQIVGAIPFAGAVLEDILEDVHLAEIRKLLSPEEYSRFIEETKVGPDTVALLRTFVEGGA